MSDLENIKKSFASSAPTDSTQTKQLELLSRRFEALEKENRRTKISIAGLSFKSSNHHDEVQKFLQEKFEIQNPNISIKEYSKNVIVDLFSPSLKAAILRTKKEKLNGTKIFIDSDRTPKEREIDWNIRQFIKNNSQQGKKVTRKGNKVLMENLEYIWSDADNSLIPHRPGIPPRRHNTTHNNHTQ